MISVESLEPGLEVGDDVMDLSGMMLISKGTKLTARHIAMLGQWGVETIPIRGDDEAGGSPEAIAPAEVAPEILSEAEQHLLARMKHINLNLPVVRQVKLMAQWRLAQQQQLAQKRKAP